MTCLHEEIKTWYFEDTNQPVGMWSCKYCGDKFIPLHQVQDAQELQRCVYEFFTTYLNRVEESDSGRLFNPITIGCCRVLMLRPLDELLDRMRTLSGAKQNPLDKMNEALKDD